MPIAIFEQLWHSRKFNFAHVSFVESLEDWDIVLFIGLCQEHGTPPGLQEILDQNFGTIQTIRRRISRMKKLGVIQTLPDRIDRRLVRFKLNREVWSTFHMFFQSFELSMEG